MIIDAPPDTIRVSAEIARSHLQWVVHYHDREGLAHLEQSFGTERLAALAEAESTDAATLIELDCCIFELFNSGLDHTSFFRDLGRHSARDLMPLRRVRADLEGVHSLLIEAAASLEASFRFFSSDYAQGPLGSGTVVHSKFQLVSELFCAMWLGYYEYCLLSARVLNPKVRQTTCAARGVDACSFSLRWAE